MPYKTTAEDFSIFEHAAKCFAGGLGLSDWEIKYAHDIHDEAMAATCTHSIDNGRIATILLNAKLPEKPDKLQLEGWAFHEVCHLLLADLWLTACKRDLSGVQCEDLMDNEVHRVIRRLENYLFDVYRERSGDIK